MKVDEKDMVGLYKIFVDEEHRFLDGHQKRVDFYTGIIIAILTGLGVGIWNATKVSHFGVITLGSLASWRICKLADEGCFRLYQRFLEAIIVRAKVEQCMRLTENINYSGENEEKKIYWDKESMLAPRHIESRLEHSNSSSQWQAHYEKEGYHRQIVRLFYVGQWVSILIFVCALLGVLLRLSPYFCSFYLCPYIYYGCS